MRPLSFLMISVLLTTACGDRAVPGVDLVPSGSPSAVESLPPTGEAGLALALELADVSEHARAAGLLEALVREEPARAEIWELFIQEARASGSPETFLDRLSVTEPIGGMGRLHHAARAELSIAARRPVDALDAANALRAEAPELSAVFRAMALVMGAEVPAGLDPSLPADALALAVLEKNPAVRARHLANASSIPGWRAALLRARAHAETGNREQAIRECVEAFRDVEPGGKLALMEARVAWLDDPKARAALASEAAHLAGERHAGEQMAAFYATAAALLVRERAADEAIAEGKALLDAFPALGGENRMRLFVPLAEAWLAVGAPHEALTLLSGEEATRVRNAPELRRSISRVQARAAYMLCDIEALADAARDLDLDEARAVTGLKALCEGDLGEARADLEPAGIAAPLGVTVALAAAQAHQGTPRAVAMARQAVALADTSGDLSSRVMTRLLAERHARLARDRAVASLMLTDLERLVPGRNMAMEIYVRRALSGGAGSAPPAAADEAPELSTWRALQSGAEVPSNSAGIGAWALARQALRAGRADAAWESLCAAMASLPSRRQDRWAPLLALAGGDGPGVETDLALATALPENSGANVVLALHEWSRRLALARLAAQVGDDLARSAPEDKARSFRVAWANESAMSLRWLIGASAFPSSELQATESAWLGLVGESAERRPPSIEAVRQRFPDTAVFSILLGANEGQVLLITPDVVSMLPLRNVSELRALAGSYFRDLSRDTSRAVGSTRPGVGDRLRRAIIDPSLPHAVGLAKYLVVAEPELLFFPWSALPEQSEGKRYLADIRSIGSVPMLQLLMVPHGAPAEGYKPDFLGMGEAVVDEPVPDADGVLDDVTSTMQAAGLKNPDEINAVSRLFGGGLAVVRLGAESTRKVYLDSAPNARYIHLSGVGVAPDGGFTLADGNLSLAEIRNQRLQARLVVVSQPADPVVQVVRAGTLLESGADSVIVAMWPPRAGLRTKWFMSLYDSLNRERSPTRALSEARETLVGDRGDTTNLDPAVWGSLVVFGAP